MDIDNKFNNYLKKTGINNNMFRLQETLKKTRIKLCNTLALPGLKYGRENWTIKARYARRITAADVKYIRKTTGYTWTVYKTNIQIAKQLNLTPVLDRIQECRRNRLQQKTECPVIDYREYYKNYKPTRRRNQGRPLKRQSRRVRPEQGNKWTNSLLVR